ncbi:MAG: hypothetical protein MJZ87_04465 [Bacteroidales bacterium]|nr:hypothetical protein [Bacteroidales bacterium]
MVVDPNGEDEWEINRWGKVVNHIQTDQHDAFYIVDKNGNRIEGKELSFKYQTIEQFKSQYSDNAHKKFDWYNVRGDNNASELFEFLSDNTNVEWAQLLLGESGENGLNVISTSHEIDRNQAATFLIENKYKYGYTIRGSIHNHPNNTPYPSGLTSPGGDIAVAKYLCKISNKNGGGQPFFKIYTPKNGKYIKYNQNSLPSDFSYFMCRSVIISKKQ